MGRWCEEKGTWQMDIPPSSLPPLPPSFPPYLPDAAPTCWSSRPMHAHSLAPPRPSPWSIVPSHELTRPSFWETPCLPSAAAAAATAAATAAAVAATCVATTTAAAAAATARVWWEEGGAGVRLAPLAPSPLMMQRERRGGEEAEGCNGVDPLCPMKSENLPPCLPPCVIMRVEWSRSEWYCCVGVRGERGRGKPHTSFAKRN